MCFTSLLIEFKSFKCCFSDVQLQYMVLWHLSRSLTLPFQGVLSTARAVYVSTGARLSLHICWYTYKSQDIPNIYLVFTEQRRKCADVVSHWCFEVLIHHSSIVFWGWWWWVLSEHSLNIFSNKKFFWLSLGKLPEWRGVYLNSKVENIVLQQQVTAR